MAAKARSGGVYHSRYDTYEHHSRFVDPGFVYDAVLAKTVGHAVIAAADADLPVQQAGDFADAHGAICRRGEEAGRRPARRGRDAEGAAGRRMPSRWPTIPTKPHADPAALTPVPKLDFAALDDAIAAMKVLATPASFRFTYCSRITP